MEKQTLGREFPPSNGRTSQGEKFIIIQLLIFEKKAKLIPQNKKWADVYFQYKKLATLHVEKLDRVGDHDIHDGLINLNIETSSSLQSLPIQLPSTSKRLKSAAHSLQESSGNGTNQTKIT